MNVVFLGTPDFAVLPLRAINDSRHKILAVITQPARPVGRKAVITPCAVETEAKKLNIKTLSYEKIRKEGVDDLKKLNPDIMVTCAYGQILSGEILNIPKFGVINIHASLLPKYRGAAPVQRAVINGEKETGVTIMQTDVGVDTGDILAVVKTEIKSDETAGELLSRLSHAGAELVVKTLDDIENGKVTPIKQCESDATYAKPIEKEDAVIDFSKTPREICDFIRGMNPKPVARTFLNGKILKIFKADISEGFGKSGEILRLDKAFGITVAACGGAVNITELQPEGGRKMTAKEFLLGRKLNAGEILGK